jgi:hypothetical protein
MFIKECIMRHIKGLWKLLCAVTLFASIMTMLAYAGTTDYALLEQGTKSDGTALLVWALVLMIPSTATLALRWIGEWYETR